MLATSKDGKSEYVLEVDKAAFEEKGVELIFASEEKPPLPLTSENIPPLPLTSEEMLPLQQQGDQDSGTNCHACACACSNNKCALM